MRLVVDILKRVRYQSLNLKQNNVDTQLARTATRNARNTYKCNNCGYKW